MINHSRFAEDLLQFYDKEARELPFRVSPRPYYTWISEIMLQQTRMETVVPYFNRFIREIPDIPALAAVEDDRLMKLWEGLGYYSRVRNLKKAAQVMVAQNGGEMPDSFAELIKLPGIGPYTAGAIASIAFGKAVPAVDGNVIRVFTRLEAYGGMVMNARGRQFIQAAVEAVISRERPGDFNQAVMELGATVCLPNGEPLCGKCPVQSHCLAFRQGDPLAYPVLPVKKQRRIEDHTVLLLRQGDSFLAERRPSEGLLAGHLQFPMKAGTLSLEETEAWLRSLGFTGWEIRQGETARHIFSHIEWHMQAFLIRVTSSQVGEGYENLKWIKGEDLTVITLPTAFKPYRQTMQRLLAEETGRRHE